jgi:hypothetical protein
MTYKSNRFVIRIKASIKALEVASVAKSIMDHDLQDKIQHHNQLV